jgi:hypothetical protein
MDPYLEDPAFWTDFHDSFLIYLRNAINRRLPRGYQARVNERLQIVDRDEVEVRLIRPDVAILRDEGRPPGGPGPAPAVVATIEPVTLPLLALDPERTTYLEIRRGETREVVTVIELLSPANKRGVDYYLYLQKRQEVFQQDIHLLELDLLLGGLRLPVAGTLPAGDYYASLSRADRRFTCDVYGWGLRDPLPTLPVPLKGPDPDIPLSLRAAFEAAYEDGLYAESLPYDRPPVAPIPERHREWVAERVRAGRG